MCDVHAGAVGASLDSVQTRPESPDNLRWSLTEKEQQAFDNLKAAVCTKPILITPDPDRAYYVVVTDASGFATGACLQQDQGNGLQPIAYMSKKMHDAETRYATHDQELLAIINALKEWRHHLHGSPYPVK